MLELNHGFRAVDVHARVSAGSATDRERSRAVSAERLERELHQAGIVRAVVAPGPQPAEEGYLRANNAVARRAAERPMLAFARIAGPRDSGDGTGDRVRNLIQRRAEHHTGPADIEQYGYDDRFHGFYLHPARDDLPDEATLEAMVDVGLPALVRGGAAFPPGQAATLLEYGFPIVLGHFGGYPLDRGLTGAAIDLLDDHEHLYLETSAVRYREILERAIREHPDRVLFGSGAPEVHPNVGVMEVLTLDVPEDAMRRVLSKNAERVVAGLAP
jgi:predicted TIM-barrel fold metal-dependent hydrolase